MKIKEINELLERAKSNPAKIYWINDQTSLYYYFNSYFIKINQTTLKIVSKYNKQKIINIIKCGEFYNNHKITVDNAVKFINENHNDKSLMYIHNLDIWLAGTPKEFLELNGYELVCRFGFDVNSEKYQQLFLDTLDIFIF